MNISYYKCAPASDSFALKALYTILSRIYSKNDSRSIILEAPKKKPHEQFLITNDCFEIIENLDIDAVIFDLVIRRAVESIKRSGINQYLTFYTLVVTNWLSFLIDTAHAMGFTPQPSLLRLINSCEELCMKFMKSLSVPIGEEYLLSKENLTTIVQTENPVENEIIQSYIDFVKCDTSIIRAEKEFHFINIQTNNEQEGRVHFSCLPLLITHNTTEPSFFAYVLSLMNKDGSLSLTSSQICVFKAQEPHLGKEINDQFIEAGIEGVIDLFKRRGVVLFITNAIVDSKLAIAFLEKRILIVANIKISELLELSSVLGVQHVTDIANLRQFEHKSDCEASLREGISWESNSEEFYLRTIDSRLYYLLIKNGSQVSKIRSQSSKLHITIFIKCSSFVAQEMSKRNILKNIQKFESLFKFGKGLPGGASFEVSLASLLLKSAQEVREKSGSLFEIETEWLAIFLEGLAQTFSLISQDYYINKGKASREIFGLGAHVFMKNDPKTERFYDDYAQKKLCLKKVFYFIKEYFLMGCTTVRL